MIRLFKVLVLLVAVMLPYSVKADMLTGGTFAQFPAGLNTVILPRVTLAPTCGFRLWNEVKGIKFAMEGTAYTTAFDLTDSTWGWGAAGYVKVRTLSLGSDNLLHVLAKGGMSTTGTPSLDPAQYQVGPVFALDLDGGLNGTVFELGIYWMSASGAVDMLGTQASLVFDFE